jgi:hypothetical protein
MVYLIRFPSLAKREIWACMRALLDAEKMEGLVHEVTMIECNMA